MINRHHLKQMAVNTQFPNSRVNYPEGIYETIMDFLLNLWRLPDGSGEIGN
jgi:hypothetical protein